MNEYRIPLTPDQEGNFGWWLFDPNPATRTKYPALPRFDDGQQTDLRAQWLAYHAPPPPEVPQGEILPKDLNDPVQFWCAEFWRHVNAAAQSRWTGPVDPSTGQYNSGLYAAGEINHFAQDSINQVAQQIGYHVVMETGDKSTATMAAMARSNARTLPDGPTKEWAASYDGHWFRADGSVVR